MPGEYDTILNELTWTGPSGAIERGCILGMLGWCGGTANVPAAATRYVSFFNGGSNLGTSANGREWITPMSGRLILLHLQTSSAQPATGALTTTLLVNGVASVVTLTVPADSEAGIFSDVQHAALVSRGDLVQLQLVNAADANSATIAGISGVLVTP